MSEPIIAVTMGDPAGIGPEVVVRAHLALQSQPSVINKVVVGDLGILQSVAEALNSPVKLVKIEQSDVGTIPRRTYQDKSALFVLDLGNVERSALVLGKPDMFTGKAAIEYIVAALQLAKSESVCAIATAPVSKKAINEAGFAFTGHTELIASALGVRDFAMMFVCERLRVFLLTSHIPLSEVPRRVTQDNVRRLIFLAERTLSRFFGTQRPRIAVCGLNPHSGEDGIIGNEEAKAIIPAIRAARLENIDVRGPFPADTLFVPATAQKFDAIIAMYHDQGLIPVKMIGFQHAVNVTVGLPVVRVSVSHGTANDIAGKWIADATSMVESLKLADKMSRVVAGS